MMRDGLIRPSFAGLSHRSDDYGVGSPQHCPTISHTSPHTVMKSALRPHVQYRYTEFTLESQTIGMIEDLENEHAWIHSTVVRPVEQ